MLRTLLIASVLAFTSVSFAQVLPLTREEILAPNPSDVQIDKSMKDLDVTLAVGFGFHLCAAKKELPSLEIAYLCPGLAPGLENFVVSLKPVKTSKPEYKMWSAPLTYTSTTPMLGVFFTYELLISYAVVDGQNYIFIDGRTMNSKTSSPTYFRITSYLDFNQLDSTHHYGAPVNVKAKTGEPLLLTPIMAVAAFNERAGKPKRPEDKK